MKNLIIGANWKSNKTKNEAKEWLDRFYNFSPREGLEVIVFPPFTLLDYVSSVIRVNDLPLKVGAQNLSSGVNGLSLTGEVALEQIGEFSDYVLLGHSERRKYLNEDENQISMKVEKVIDLEAQGKKIEPILCVSSVQGVNSLTKQGMIIAYEPLEAIGTGNPASPQDVAKIVSEIKGIVRGARVLYGGSVKPENVVDYLSTDIDGFLIGGASLDPDEFINILKNV